VVLYIRNAIAQDWDYSAIDESLAEMRDNGQVQTKVCRQSKGVQSVDVISEEQILGKFFRPRRERPSPEAESALVTKTGPPLGNTYP
jgi:hypothetical protein